MVLIMEECGYIDDEKELIGCSWISLSTGSAKNLANGYYTERRKKEDGSKKDSNS